jgi:glycosyltransferase involved in cell wall biosynthesis
MGNIPEISCSNAFPFVDYQYIGASFLRQIIHTISFLRSHSTQHICLIGGDIWIGGIQITLLNVLFSSRTRTQISIHGIPNLTNNVINRFLRRVYLRLLFSKVDSIRAVSRPLIDFLTSSYRVNKNKFFVSPIPVAMPTEHSLRVRDIDIAIVGRLHPERGTYESMQIIDLFSSMAQTPSVHFFGDGPLRQSLQAWMNSKPNHELISLHGHLTNTEIVRHLGLTRILLSCAPEEGYGLSLREALVSGAYVVARLNSGTLELSEQFPDAVFLFESVPQAHELISRLLAKQYKSFDNEEIVKKQKNVDQSSLKLLANSWTR